MTCRERVARPGRKLAHHLFGKLGLEPLDSLGASLALRDSDHSDVGVHGENAGADKLGLVGEGRGDELESVVSDVALHEDMCLEILTTASGLCSASRG